MDHGNSPDTLASRINFIIGNHENASLVSRQAELKVGTPVSHTLTVCRGIFPPPTSYHIIGKEGNDKISGGVVMSVFTLLMALLGSAKLTGGEGTRWDVFTSSLPTKASLRMPETITYFDRRHDMMTSTINVRRVAACRAGSCRTWIPLFAPAWRQPFSPTPARAQRCVTRSYEHCSLTLA